MKKFGFSSRVWVLMACAALILMVGAVKVLDQKPNVATDSDLGTEVPLNTLDDDLPPPMPLETVSEKPPLDLPLPVAQKPPSSKSPTEERVEPVVWVSEDGASAYSQPGFNMPKLRDLKKWEELKIVESTTEAWDRVRDSEGQEFWVQKKIVTIIRPQNLSQPSFAEKTVMGFYTAVAHNEHNEAYDDLSPDWKRELSFDAFVKGYARTDSLRSEIVNVFELGQDSFQVDVSMEAVEEGEPVDYLGIYTVEKLDGKWFLTSGSLKRQARAVL